MNMDLEDNDSVVSYMMHKKNAYRRRTYLTAVISGVSIVISVAMIVVAIANVMNIVVAMIALSIPAAVAVVSSAVLIRYAYKMHMITQECDSIQSLVLEEIAWEDKGLSSLGVEGDSPDNVGVIQSLPENWQKFSKIIFNMVADCKSKEESDKRLYKCIDRFGVSVTCVLLEEYCRGIKNGKTPLEYLGSLYRKHSVFADKGSDGSEIVKWDYSGNKNNISLVVCPQSAEDVRSMNNSVITWIRFCISAANCSTCPEDCCVVVYDVMLRHLLSCQASSALQSIDMTNVFSVLMQEVTKSNDNVKCSMLCVLAQLNHSADIQKDKFYVSYDGLSKYQKHKVFLPSGLKVYVSDCYAEMLQDLMLKINYDNISDEMQGALQELGVINGAMRSGVSHDGVRIEDIDDNKNVVSSNNRDSGGVLALHDDTSDDIGSDSLGLKSDEDSDKKSASLEDELLFSSNAVTLLLQNNAKRLDDLRNGQCFYDFDVSKKGVTNNTVDEKNRSVEDALPASSENNTSSIRDHKQHLEIDDSHEKTQDCLSESDAKILDRDSSINESLMSMELPKKDCVSVQEEVSFLEKMSSLMSRVLREKEVGTCFTSQEIISLREEMQMCFLVLGECPRNIYADLGVDKCYGILKLWVTTVQESEASGDNVFIDSLPVPAGAICGANTDCDDVLRRQEVKRIYSSSLLLNCLEYNPEILKKQGGDQHLTLQDFVGKKELSLSDLILLSSDTEVRHDRMQDISFQYNGKTYYFREEKWARIISCIPEEDYINLCDHTCAELQEDYLESSKDHKNILASVLQQGSSLLTSPLVIHLLACEKCPLFIRSAIFSKNDIVEKICQGFTKSNLELYQDKSQGYVLISNMDCNIQKAVKEMLCNIIEGLYAMHSRDDNQEQGIILSFRTVILEYIPLFREMFLSGELVENHGLILQFWQYIVSYTVRVIQDSSDNILSSFIQRIRNKGSDDSPLTSSEMLAEAKTLLEESHNEIDIDTSMIMFFISSFSCIMSDVYCSRVMFCLMSYYYLDSIPSDSLQDIALYSDGEVCAQLRDIVTTDLGRGTYCYFLLRKCILNYNADNKRYFVNLLTQLSAQDIITIDDINNIITCLINELHSNNAVFNMEYVVDMLSTIYNYMGGMIEKEADSFKRSGLLPKASCENDVSKYGVSIANMHDNLINIVSCICKNSSKISDNNIIKLMDNLCNVCFEVLQGENARQCIRQLFHVIAQSNCKEELKRLLYSSVFSAISKCEVLSLLCVSIGKSCVYKMTHDSVFYDDIVDDEIQIFDKCLLNILLQSACRCLKSMNTGDRLEDVMDSYYKSDLDFFRNIIHASNDNEFVKQLLQMLLSTMYVKESTDENMQGVIIFIVQCLLNKYPNALREVIDDNYNVPLYKLLLVSVHVPGLCNTVIYNTGANSTNAINHSVEFSIMNALVDGLYDEYDIQDLVLKFLRELSALEKEYTNDDLDLIALYDMMNARYVLYIEMWIRIINKHIKCAKLFDSDKQDGMTFFKEDIKYFSIMCYYVLNADIPTIQNRDGLLIGFISIIGQNPEMIAEVFHNVNLLCAHNSDYSVGLEGKMSMIDVYMNACLQCIWSSECSVAAIKGLGILDACREKCTNEAEYVSFFCSIQKALETIQINEGVNRVYALCAHGLVDIISWKENDVEFVFKRATAFPTLMQLLAISGDYRDIALKCINLKMNALTDGVNYSENLKNIMVIIQCYGDDILDESQWATLEEHTKDLSNVNEEELLMYLKILSPRFINMNHNMGAISRINMLYNNIVKRLFYNSSSWKILHGSVPVRNIGADLSKEFTLIPSEIVECLINHLVYCALIMKGDDFNSELSNLFNNIVYVISKSQQENASDDLALIRDSVLSGLRFSYRDINGKEHISTLCGLVIEVWNRVERWRMEYDKKIELSYNGGAFDAKNVQAEVKDDINNVLDPTSELQKEILYEYGSYNAQYSKSSSCTESDDNAKSDIAENYYIASAHCTKNSISTIMWLKNEYKRYFNDMMHEEMYVRGKNMHTYDEYDLSSAEEKLFSMLGGYHSLNGYQSNKMLRISQGLRSVSERNKENRDLSVCVAMEYDCEKEVNVNMELNTAMEYSFSLYHNMFKENQLEMYKSRGIICTTEELHHHIKIIFDDRNGVLYRADYLFHKDLTNSGYSENGKMYSLQDILEAMLKDGYFFDVEVLRILLLNVSTLPVKGFESFSDGLSYIKNLPNIVLSMDHLGNKIFLYDKAKEQVLSDNVPQGVLTAPSTAQDNYYCVDNNVQHNTILMINSVLDDEKYIKLLICMLSSQGKDIFCEEDARKAKLFIQNDSSSSDSEMEMWRIFDKKVDLADQYKNVVSNEVLHDFLLKIHPRFLSLVYDIVRMHKENFQIKKKKLLAKIFKNHGNKPITSENLEQWENIIKSEERISRSQIWYNLYALLSHTPSCDVSIEQDADKDLHMFSQEKQNPDDASKNMSYADLLQIDVGDNIAGINAIDNNIFRLLFFEWFKDGGNNHAVFYQRVGDDVFDSKYTQDNILSKTLHGNCRDFWDQCIMHNGKGTFSEIKKKIKKKLDDDGGIGFSMEDGLIWNRNSTIGYALKCMCALYEVLGRSESFNDDIARMNEIKLKQCKEVMGCDDHVFLSWKTQIIEDIYLGEDDVPESKALFCALHYKELQYLLCNVYNFLPCYHTGKMMMSGIKEHKLLSAAPITALMFNQLSTSDIIDKNAQRPRNMSCVGVNQFDNAKTWYNAMKQSTGQLSTYMVGNTKQSLQKMGEFVMHNAMQAAKSNIAGSITDSVFQCAIARSPIVNDIEGESHSSSIKDNRVKAQSTAKEALNCYSVLREKMSDKQSSCVLSSQLRIAWEDVRDDEWCSMSSGDEVRAHAMHICTKQELLKRISPCVESMNCTLPALASMVPSVGVNDNTVSKLPAVLMKTVTNMALNRVWDRRKCALRIAVTKIAQHDGIAKKYTQSECRGWILELQDAIDEMPRNSVTEDEKYELSSLLLRGEYSNNEQSRYRNYECIAKCIKEIRSIASYLQKHCNNKGPSSGARVIDRKFEDKYRWKVILMSQILNTMRAMLGKDQQLLQLFSDRVKNILHELEGFDNLSNVEREMLYSMGECSEKRKMIQYCLGSGNFQTLNDRYRAQMNSGQGNILMSFGVFQHLSDLHTGVSERISLSLRSAQEAICKTLPDHTYGTCMQSVVCQADNGEDAYTVEDVFHSLENYHSFGIRSLQSSRIFVRDASEIRCYVLDMALYARKQGYQGFIELYNDLKESVCPEERVDDVLPMSDNGFEMFALQAKAGLYMCIKRQIELYTLSVNDDKVYVSLKILLFRCIEYAKSCAEASILIFGKQMDFSKCFEGIYNIINAHVSIAHVAKNMDVAHEINRRWKNIDINVFHEISDAVKNVFIKEDPMFQAMLPDVEAFADVNQYEQQGVSGKSLHNNTCNLDQCLIDDDKYSKITRTKSTFLAMVFNSVSFIPPQEGNVSKLPELAEYQEKTCTDWMAALQEVCQQNKEKTFGLSSDNLDMLLSKRNRYIEKLRTLIKQSIVSSQYLYRGSIRQRNPGDHIQFDAHVYFEVSMMSIISQIVKARNVVIQEIPRELESILTQYSMQFFQKGLSAGCLKYLSYIRDNVKWIGESLEMNSIASGIKDEKSNMWRYIDLDICRDCWDKDKISAIAFMDNNNERAENIILNYFKEGRECLSKIMQCEHDIKVYNTVKSIKEVGRVILEDGDESMQHTQDDVIVLDEELKQEMTQEMELVLHDNKQLRKIVIPEVLRILQDITQKLSAQKKGKILLSDVRGMYFVDIEELLGIFGGDELLKYLEQASSKKLIALMSLVEKIENSSANTEEQYYFSVNQLFCYIRSIHHEMEYHEYYKDLDKVFDTKVIKDVYHDNHVVQGKKRDIMFKNRQLACMKFSQWYQNLYKVGQQQRLLLLSDNSENDQEDNIVFAQASSAVLTHECCDDMRKYILDIWQIRYEAESHLVNNELTNKLKDILKAKVPVIVLNDLCLSMRLRHCMNSLRGENNISLVADNLNVSEGGHHDLKNILAQIPNYMNDCDENEQENLSSFDMVHAISPMLLLAMVNCFTDHGNIKEIGVLISLMHIALLHNRFSIINCLVLAISPNNITALSHKNSSISLSPILSSMHKLSIIADFSEEMFVLWEEFYLSCTKSGNKLSDCLDVFIEFDSLLRQYAVDIKLISQNIRKNCSDYFASSAMTLFREWIKVIKSSPSPKDQIEHLLELPMEVSTENGQPCKVLRVSSDVFAAHAVGLGYLPVGASIPRASRAGDDIISLSNYISQNINRTLQHILNKKTNVLLRNFYDVSNDTMYNMCYIQGLGKTGFMKIDTVDGRTPEGFAQRIKDLEGRISRFVCKEFTSILSKKNGDMILLNRQVKLLESIMLYMRLFCVNDVYIECKEKEESRKISALEEIRDKHGAFLLQFVMEIHDIGVADHCINAIQALFTNTLCREKFQLMKWPRIRRFLLSQVYSMTDGMLVNIVQVMNVSYDPVEAFKIEREVTTVPDVSDGVPRYLKLQIAFFSRYILKMSNVTIGEHGIVNVMYDLVRMFYDYGAWNVDDISGEMNSLQALYQGRDGSKLLSNNGNKLDRVFSHAKMQPAIVTDFLKILTVVIGTNIQKRGSVSVDDIMKLSKNFMSMNLTIQMNILQYCEDYIWESTNVQCVSSDNFLDISKLNTIIIHCMEGGEKVKTKFGTIEKFQESIQNYHKKLDNAWLPLRVSRKEYSEDVVLLEDDETSSEELVMLAKWFLDNTLIPVHNEHRLYHNVEKLHEKIRQECKNTSDVIAFITNYRRMYQKEDQALQHTCCLKDISSNGINIQYSSLLNMATSLQDNVRIQRLQMHNMFKTKNIVLEEIAQQEDALVQLSDMLTDLHNSILSLNVFYESGQEYVYATGNIMSTMLMLWVKYRYIKQYMNDIYNRSQARLSEEEMRKDIISVLQMPKYFVEALAAHDVNDLNVSFIDAKKYNQELRDDELVMQMSSSELGLNFEQQLESVKSSCADQRKTSVVKALPFDNMKSMYFLITYIRQYMKAYSEQNSLTGQEGISQAYRAICFNVVKGDYNLREWPKLLQSYLGGKIFWIAFIISAAFDTKKLDIEVPHAGQVLMLMLTSCRDDSKLLIKAPPGFGKTWGLFMTAFVKILDCKHAEIMESKYYYKETNPCKRRDKIVIITHSEVNMLDMFVRYKELANLLGIRMNIIANNTKWKSIADVWCNSDIICTTYSQIVATDSICMLDNNKTFSEYCHDAKYNVRMLLDESHKIMEYSRSGAHNISTATNEGDIEGRFLYDMNQIISSYITSGYLDHIENITIEDMVHDIIMILQLLKESYDIVIENWSKQELLSNIIKNTIIRSMNIDSLEEGKHYVVRRVQYASGKNELVVQAVDSVSQSTNSNLRLQYIHSCVNEIVSVINHEDNRGKQKVITLPLITNNWTSVLKELFVDAKDVCCTTATPHNQALHEAITGATEVVELKRQKGENFKGNYVFCQGTEAQYKLLIEIIDSCFSKQHAVHLNLKSIKGVTNFAAFVENEVLFDLANNPKSVWKKYTSFAKYFSVDKLHKLLMMEGDIARIPALEDLRETNDPFQVILTTDALNTGTDIVAHNVVVDTVSVTMRSKEDQVQLNNRSNRFSSKKGGRALVVVDIDDPDSKFSCLDDEDKRRIQSWAMISKEGFSEKDMVSEDVVYEMYPENSLETPAKEMQDRIIIESIKRYFTYYIFCYTRIQNPLEIMYGGGISASLTLEIFDAHVRNIQDKEKWRNKFSSGRNIKAHYAYSAALEKITVQAQKIARDTTQWPEEYAEALDCRCDDRIKELPEIYEMLQNAIQSASSEINEALSDKVQEECHSRTQKTCVTITEDELQTVARNDNSAADAKNIQKDQEVDSTRCSEEMHNHLYLTQGDWEALYDQYRQESNSAANDDKHHSAEAYFDASQVHYIT